MRKITQTRRQAGVYSDRPILSVGSRALPAAWTVGEGEGALCPASGAGGNEQSHDLDSLLRTPRVLPGLRSALYVGALSRPVRICPAAVFDLGARRISAPV